MSTTNKKVSKEQLIQLNKTCTNIFNNVSDLLLLFKNNEELKSTAYFTYIFGEQVVTSIMKRMRESKQFLDVDIEHYDIIKDMTNEEKSMFYTRVALYDAISNEVEKLPSMRF